MPWAAGSRNCVGMPQAQVTMQATLATLLSRFSFRLAERVRPSDQGWHFCSELGHLLVCSCTVYRTAPPGRDALCIVRIKADCFDASSSPPG